MKHHEQRLAAVFQHALLLAAATTACGATKEVADSSAPGDATVQDGSITDASTDTIGDALDDDPCSAQAYTPVVMDLCADFHRLPCGFPEDASRGNCYFTYEACKNVCKDFFYNCIAIDDSCNDGSVVWDADGGLKLECSWCVGGPGRAPAGLAIEAFPNTMAGWFARAAFLEAASVRAFRTFRRELRLLGAPTRLVRAARRAEADERRHARSMATIAKRLGSSIPRPRATNVGTRSIEAIAVENVTEGCVGETYAALEALHQSEHGPVHLRPTFRAIARDEMRHAALAWAVASWLEPQLSSEERVRLCAQKRTAVRRLYEATIDAPVARRVGLPDAAARHRMLGELERSLWS